MRLFVFILLTSLIGVTAFANDTAEAYTTTNSSAVVDPPRPPRINYSANICPGDPTNVDFILVDKESGVDYDWMYPTSLDAVANISTDQCTLTISDITLLGPLETIFVRAMNSCGQNFTTCPVTIVTPLTLPEIPLITICTGDAMLVSPLQTTRVRSYEWDFGPQADWDVAEGSLEDGEPFSVRFNSQGLKRFSVTITDSNGCTHFKDYQVQVYNPPPNPFINCIDGGDLIASFEWVEDPNPDFRYEIDYSLMASNLVVTPISDTKIDVTGFRDQCQYAILKIIVYGPNPAPCDTLVQSLPCRPSKKPSASFRHPKKQWCIGDSDASTPQPLIAVINGVENPPADGEWTFDSVNGQTGPDPGFTFDPPTGATGTFDPTGLLPGTYSCLYVWTNPETGCTEEEPVSFNIFERTLPDAMISATDICATESITLEYVLFEDIAISTSFISGMSAGLTTEIVNDSTRVYKFANRTDTYELEVKYERAGCEPQFQFFTINVVGEPDLELECGTDQRADEIDITWTDIGVPVDVLVNNNPRGAAMGGTHTITALETNRDYDIILVAQTLSCGEVRDTIVCSTVNCPEPPVDRTSLDNPLCGDPVTGAPLGIFIGGAGGYTWDSAHDNLFVDKTPGQEIFKPFDPLITDYTLIANYQDITGCMLEIPFTFVYYTEPEPFLALDKDTVCVGDVVMFQSNNVANASLMDYGTNFPGSADVLSGTNQGPYEITFDLAGEYDLGMQLTIGGFCQGDPASLPIVVVDPPALNANCRAQGESSITLAWDDLGLEYTVLQDMSPAGNTDLDSLELTGLAEKETFEFIISATDPFCGMISDTISCITFACTDPIVVDAVQDSTFCFDPLQGAFLLDVTVEADVANGGVPGTFVWDTPLVDSANNFTPDDPLKVDYTVTGIWSDDDNCSKNISFDFTFVQTPEMVLNVIGQDTICEGTETITVLGEFTGTNVSELEFVPDFPAGVTIEDNPSEGRYVLSFDGQGDYDLGMSVNYFGCAGSRADKMVHVKAKPDLDLQCGAVENTAVNLEWNDLGSSSYQIKQDGIIQDPSTDLSIRIDDLIMNESYTYIVETITDCGLIADTVTCQTFVCPLPVIDLSGLDTDICHDSSTGPYQLNVALESIDPLHNGTYSWDTPLVDATDGFTPDDITLTEYNIDILYTDDNGCDSTVQVMFNYTESPRAMLTVLSEDTICSNATITLMSDYTAADMSLVTFTTDFPAEATIESGADAGPYELSFSEAGTYRLGISVDNNGCAGVLDTVVVVVEASPELDLRCGAVETNAVNLEWDDLGVTDYEIQQEGETPMSSSDLTLRIENLVMDSVYQYVVETMTSCGLISDTVKCQTFICPLASVDISGVPADICHDSSTGPFELDVVIGSIDPDDEGTYTWDTPLVDENDGFMPADISVTDYTLDILYDDKNGCDSLVQVSFTYTESPRAMVILTSPDTICIDGGTVTLMSEYTGADMTLVNFMPAFPAEAVVNSGNGAGPYELSFTEAGTYELGISVDDNGCSGGVENVTVVVQPAIEQTVVMCEEDYGAINLSWTALNCVSTYKIYVDGEFIENVSGLETTISGLEEDTEYDYIIEPISNCLCEAKVTTGTCSTLECPPVIIALMTVDTCFNTTLPAFGLPADVTSTGDIPGGTGEWSGDIISADGMVDPSILNGPDTYTVTYAFTEGPCVTTLDTEVTFHAPPVIDAEPFGPECPDDEMGMVIVSVEGGEPDYSYMLNGDAAQPENIFPEVPIGIYIVEVKDGNGCIASSQVIVENSDDPSMDIEGEELIVEGNDALFDLFITDLDTARIKNITWYLNGSIACEGINCTSLELTNVTVPGELIVEIDYGTDCLLSEAKSFEINEINSVYIPNMVDFSGVLGPPNNEWKAIFKGSESFITSVQVFDRWGNMVRDYENKSMDYFKEFLIWDGFSGSVAREQGVYTYVIGLLIEGETEIKYGNVTILR